jgi:IstB-like ATP binding protein
LPPNIIAAIDYRNAPVAQLDRAFGFEPKGRRFESFRARQISKQFEYLAFLACAGHPSVCHLAAKRIQIAPSSPVISRGMTRLLNEFAQARADGSMPHLLRRFTKVPMLIIDDFGPTTLSANERRDFLEFLDDRYDISSTVIANLSRRSDMR